MNATIESTNAIVEVKPGVRARVWEGRTEGGVPFTAYIMLCQVLTADDNAEFERDLQEERKAPNDATRRAIDARML